MPSEQHEAFVELIKAGTPLAADDIEGQRANMVAMTENLPLAEGTVCEDAMAGDVPVTWVTAAGADPDRVVMYLHGGGYVIGSRVTHRSLASRISATAAARVLLVEYRLAPEAPFPAAVDDAQTAWNWMLEQGVAAERAAIAGDSAGGGLTLAVLQRIRASDAPLPACAVCLSPWADLEGTGESARPGVVDDPMIVPENLADFGRTYAQDATGDPLASPIHADYAGFPPLLIQVGTREVLLSDSRTVAEKARAAGVEVVLEEEPDLIHVFQAFAGVPEADAAVERIGTYVQARTG